MKLTKALVGKEVRVIWHDPCSFDLSGPEPEFVLGRLRRGIANLPTWKERGVVSNIEGGVLVLLHSESLNNPLNDDASGSMRVQGSLIPGDLIDHITILEANVELEDGKQEGTSPVT